MIGRTSYGGVHELAAMRAMSCAAADHRQGGQNKVKKALRDGKDS
jgi:hypothetical protein